jgi:hypothetical protein
VTAWSKSTRSASNNGNCVEADTWRKSSYSADKNRNCVEVGRGGPAVVVRDIMDQAGAVLAFGTDAWQRFAATVKGADWA